MDRQTDWLLPCCQTAGSRQDSGREPEKGVAFVFLGRVCRDQRRTAWRKGRTRRPCCRRRRPPPHCVQSTERDVEYQKESEVEEVLSHRPSVIVLHDPLQADPTSLIWSSVHHFDLTFFGLLHTHTNIVEQQCSLWKKQQLKICQMLWFQGCTGIHGCISTGLLCLRLFPFWISQSRLPLLIVLVEIVLIAFDYRLIFKVSVCRI